MMKKPKKDFTDIERNNRLGMTTHWIVVLIALTFCFLQLLSARATVPFVLAATLLGLIAPIGELILWKRNPGTSLIKHFLSYGFAVFYTYILFTAENNLVFLFAVPLLLIITVYNDTRYTILINIGIVLESLIVSILGAQTGGFGYAGFDSAIMQNVVMIMIALFSFLATKTINQNLSQKLNSIRLIVQNTETGITEIYGEMEKLRESSKATETAMNEVTTGTADTAAAVSNQLLMTRSIGEQVETVGTHAAEMSETLAKTLLCVDNGNQDMIQLTEKVDASVSTSTEAAAKLKKLNENIKEMNSILKMIDDIAFQTNILALNANVEAARAGEAGRGFSVVASQVSEMSIRTKDATENITGLIHNVAVSLNEVTDVIGQMAKEIEEEKICTRQAMDSFSSISDNTQAVRDEVGELVNNITRLTDANRGIMDSVQTISAISEEVCALANEAMSSEENNVGILDGISVKMQLLVEKNQSSDT